MNEATVYGIGALLICFTIATFFLSRMQTDIFPEDYEFRLDPFWYVTGIMFAGSIVLYFLFPQTGDTIKDYHLTDFMVPFVLAFLIYGAYLLDINWVANLLTFGAALAVSYMQPDDFILFPAYLTMFQDKFAVAFIIFILSKGLGLLNGLGAIASMQFMTVMSAIAILSYLGALPLLSGVVALALAGTMLAFCFFSWPPEKIIMSNGGFSAIGFIMGCFMLHGAVEYAEASMFISASYLIVELGKVLYDRYIYGKKFEYDFMGTAYFQISQDGKYEKGVILGILKILIVNLVLAMIQIAASERFALPMFAVALNLWFLSILSGNTKPQEILSLTKLGAKATKGIFTKKKGNKEKK